MAGFVKKVLKAGLGVFTSRIFGMLRDMTIAAVFGATYQTDAFFVAFAVPNLFRAFFAEGALSSVFMPFLSDKLKNSGERSASNFMTSLIIAVSFFILVILFIVMLYPKHLAMLFMPGYVSDHDILVLAARMIVILMPYLLFVSVCALLSCYLNLKGIYYLPSASTALLNLSMIAGAFAGYHFHNIMYLCYGVFIGGIFQLLLVIVATIKAGYRPLSNFSYDKEVDKLFLMVLPSIAGVGINQINFMVGRMIASFLAVGSISYLYFANRLFQFPLGLFAIAVGTVTLTEISVANSDGRVHLRNRLIDKSINSILMIMLPATAGLIILARPIIALVYGHHEFSSFAVDATALDLQAYTVGLIFYSLISVVSRIFYSDKVTSIPVKGAAIGFVFNLVLNYLFIDRLGHAGIALASSLAALLNCVYLFYELKGYRYSIKTFFMFIIRLLGAVAIMSLAVWYLNVLGVHILVNIAFGCLIYFMALKALKINIKEVLR